MLKTSILAVTLATTGIAVHAQQTEKNGLPCVAEICLGDGLEELTKVPWDRAKNPFSSDAKPLYVGTRKVIDSELRLLKTTYPGDVSGAAAYLASGQFDADALPALGDVKAACNLKEIEGTYKSPSGHPTRVKIALIPDAKDAAQQRWTVTSIMRTFPTAVTREQQEQIAAQLKERYAAFGGKGNIRNPKPGEGRFSMNAMSLFGFHLYRFGGIDLSNRLKQHPACGGTTKVNVD